jgi:hypothetical protein
MTAKTKMRQITIELLQNLLRQGLVEECIVDLYILLESTLKQKLGLKPTKKLGIKLSGFELIQIAQRKDKINFAQFKQFDVLLKAKNKFMSENAPISLPVASQIKELISSVFQLSNQKIQATDLDFQIGERKINKTKKFLKDLLEQGLLEECVFDTFSLFEANLKKELPNNDGLYFIDNAKDKGIINKKQKSEFIAFNLDRINIIHQQAQIKISKEKINEKIEKVYAVLGKIADPTIISSAPNAIIIQLKSNPRLTIKLGNYAYQDQNFQEAFDWFYKATKYDQNKALQLQTFLSIKEIIDENKNANIWIFSWQTIKLYVVFALNGIQKAFDEIKEAVKNSNNFDTPLSYAYANSMLSKLCINFQNERETLLEDYARKGYLSAFVELEKCVKENKKCDEAKILLGLSKQNVIAKNICKSLGLRLSLFERIKNLFGG